LQHFPEFIERPLLGDNEVTGSHSLKMKKMKTKNMLPIIALLMVGLLGSCTQEEEVIVRDSSSSSMYSSSSSKKSIKTVDLGVAGEFVILSKSGITNVYKSSVVGDVGTSPITGAALLLKCNEVTGTIYTVDAAGPLPCRVTNATRLGTAVLDMQAAYTDAAGRSKPDFLNLGAGNIGGLTLTPGLYTWTSALVIPTDITISGSSTDIFILQVAGTINMSSAVGITLKGGAQANNIFWVASGAVTLGTTSHFEGNILSKTGINMQTGASINGRMLAQTAVTLQKNSIVMP